MARPRSQPAPPVPSGPVPPGPHRLEIRYDDKIVCLQRVHSYSIDQRDESLTVTGVLKLDIPKSAPTIGVKVTAGGDVTPAGS